MKAIAVKNGMLNSTVAEAQYVIKEAPVEPEQPVDPEKPIKPEKPNGSGERNNAGTKENVPPTGDTMNILLWLLVVIMTVVTGGIGILRKR